MARVMVVTSPCDVRIPHGLVAYPPGEFHVPEEHARQIKAQGKGHPHPTKQNKRDMNNERDTGPSPHDRAASAG
jgi:hypothetical protein